MEVILTNAKSFIMQDVIAFSRTHKIGPHIRLSSISVFVIQVFLWYSKPFCNIVII